MHFTRDPIVETIITPKEGHKLSIRSSKGAKAEEHLVDAVEVISFGNVYFFRSLERPKAFLLPLGDYEVLEIREMKVPLKATSYEKAIKIPTRKDIKIEEKNVENLEDKSKEKKHKEITQPIAKNTVATEGKKTNESRKNKRAKRKGNEEKKEEVRTEPPKEKKLVPPPTTLISETINRYKTILLPEEVKNPGEEAS